jgi:hypothetical protein
MPTRPGLHIFVTNISNMGIFSHLLLLIQHLGYGMAYINVNLCLPPVLVSKSRSILISRFELLLGFQHCLLSSLIRNFPIIGSYQWEQSLILLLHEQINGICVLFNLSLMLYRYKRSQKFISLETQCKFIWIFSTSGRFTTNSAYLQVKSKSANTAVLLGTSSDFWKKLWKLNLNDRLRLFLWKIAWNILPTRERINSLFSVADRASHCPLCKSGEDSLQHLFFQCAFARIIWCHSPWPIDYAALIFGTLLDWIKVILSPGLTLHIPKDDHHKFQIFAAMACIFYGLLETKPTMMVSLLMHYICPDK